MRDRAEEGGFFHRGPERSRTVRARSVSDPPPSLTPCTAGRVARAGERVARVAAVELFVALVLSVSASERDLLLVLLDGASEGEAAVRLGIQRAVLDVRLHRLRRRAARLGSEVKDRG